MSADNWTQCPRCGKDFREDYELGVDSEAKEFFVNYRGSCGTIREPGCGYQFKFKTQKPLDITPAA